MFTFCCTSCHCHLFFFLKQPYICSRKNDGTAEFLLRQKSLKKKRPGIRGGNCCPPHKKKNLPMKPWQFGSRIETKLKQAALPPCGAWRDFFSVFVFFLGGGGGKGQWWRWPFLMGLMMGWWFWGWWCPTSSWQHGWFGAVGGFGDS